MNGRYPSRLSSNVSARYLELQELMRRSNPGHPPVLSVEEAREYLEEARRVKREVDVEVHEASSDMHGSGLVRQISRGVPAAMAFMQGRNAHRAALARSFDVDQVVRFADRLYHDALQRSVTDQGGKDESKPDDGWRHRPPGERSADRGQEI